jgi:hypothetical protein
MPFSTTEIKDIVIEIEDRFPVDTWLMNGIHVWPLVRIQIYFELFFAGRDQGYSTSNKSKILSGLAPFIRIVNSVFQFSKSYVSDLKHNTSTNRSADCLFLTYTVHRTLLTGRWYDKYCDPYVDALTSLGLRSLVLEMAAKEEYRVPRYGRSKFIQPALEGIMIKSRLQWKSVSLRESLCGFTDMIDCLEKENPDMTMPSLERLRSQVVQLINLKEYFRKILADVKPTVVFVAEYYSLYGMALILACRQCCIATVDIQHGMQGDEHLAYGCWSKIPRTGYELLPSVFWCWSDYEAGVINKWNQDVLPIHKTFVGGDLWLNLWREKSSEIVSYYDNMIGRFKYKTGRPLHVLVTLGLLSDLKEWILTAIQASFVDIFWWIRVHPCRLEEREIVREILKEFGITNVVLDQATDLPLQALLRHVNVNVTAFSSTVFDAECYGIPSVLTDSAGVTLFSEQTASGLAVTASNADELLKAIKEQTAKYGTMQRGLETETIEAGEIVGNFLSIHGGITFPVLQ